MLKQGNSELIIYINNNVKGLRLADGEYLPCKATVLNRWLPYSSTQMDMFAKQAGLEVTSTSRC